jgi:hypothetical protein
MAAAQTHGEKEQFTAIAIANNNIVTGAGTVLIDITRWSTEAERSRLVNTLMKKGADALLDELRDARPVGRIRTPDSLGYDLHYAQQTRDAEGNRQIVIATDRPVSFWEAVNRPRTIDYPFTVIQMQIGREGKGKGTMSFFTKIRARGNNTIELEDYATAPVMLTEIEARKTTE